MKLRIHGNSLRLRLSQTEVCTLASAGVVENRVQWPGGTTLCYRLEALEGGPICSTFERQRILIGLPKERVAEWARSQEEGIYGEQEWSGGRLKIAVEKDYACIDGPAEENVDAFPNPKAPCT